MSAFGPIFSEIIFKRSGLVREDSDLDYRLSEDIGNLNDLAPNEIYRNIIEIYPLIEDGVDCFPIRYQFSDAELSFQHLISKDGYLSLSVHATDQFYQVLELEVSMPTVINSPNSNRKIISIFRTQKMIVPYTVEYDAEFEESMTKDSFEKLALAYSLTV